MEHIGIYLSNSANKDVILEDILANNFLQNHIDLSALHGELFSDITVNRIINEELKHDHFLITTNENHSLMSMSSGQQRIVLVVRALVKHPPLLILDEPTVGLDDENTQLFINLISAIASQRKVAIIYVSHRSEPEMNPDKIFELRPTPEGSTGHVAINTHENQHSKD